MKLVLTDVTSLTGYPDPHNTVLSSSCKVLSILPELQNPNCVASARELLSKIKVIQFGVAFLVELGLFLDSCLGS